MVECFSSLSLQKYRGTHKTHLEHWIDAWKVSKKLRTEQIVLINLFYLYSRNLVVAFCVLVSTRPDVIYQNYYQSHCLGIDLLGRHTVPVTTQVQGNTNTLSLSQHKYRVTLTHCPCHNTSTG